MIEVIYKEEKKKPTGNEEFFRIPRNIRQIGENNGTHKIYLEDYVYTFLNKVAEQSKEEGRVTILLGCSNWQEGVSYTFIKGAVLAENMDAAQEKMAFTDEIWTSLEEKEKEYFPDLEVVGWSFALGDLPMKVSDSIQRAHLNYFGGNEKVLFFMEPLEKEEAFFHYENGQMVRQEGYYIYYEKNPQMQEYMLGLEGKFAAGIQEEVEDGAVTAFRKIIGRKREGQEGEEEIQRKSPMLMYAASACLAVSVLAVGINYLNNYDKMKDAAKTVQEVASLSDKAEDSREMEKEGQGFQEDELAVSAGVEKQVQEENALSSADGSDSQGESSSLARRGNSSFAQEDTGQLDENKEENAQDSEIETSSEEEPSKEEAAGEEEMSPTPTPRERKKASEEAAEGTEKAAAEAHQSYEVQFGDSLYKISTEQYGDMSMIQEICRLNGISTNDIIYPGQIILLP